MKVADQTVKRIVKKVIRGEDYRIEIVNLINADFLRFTIEFFKKIIEAKMKNENITIDWYRKEFLNDKLSSDELAIYSGLNMKTIKNMYGSNAKEIVLDAAQEHYDKLYETINELIDDEEDLALTLSIKFNQVSVELTINETLLVINTLAVKRAALRGGAWSSAGKEAEKVLMKTLCKMYRVPEKNFEEKFERDRAAAVSREVDFYLKDNKGNRYLCEVKLMGQGNPESADAIFARKSNVFVADKLSDQNKNQADQLDVVWVELRSKDGYKRIEKAFDKYNIPYNNYDGNLDNDLDDIIDSIVDD